MSLNDKKRSLYEASIFLEDIVIPNNHHTGDPKEEHRQQRRKHYQAKLRAKVKNRKIDSHI